MTYHPAYDPDLEIPSGIDEVESIQEEVEDSISSLSPPLLLSVSVAHINVSGFTVLSLSSILQWRRTEKIDILCCVETLEDDSCPTYPYALNTNHLQMYIPSTPQGELNGSVPWGRIVNYEERLVYENPI